MVVNPGDLYPIPETWMGADLSDSNMTDAILSGANLHGANLRYYNLSNTVLDNANLTNIKYNDETIWPENFEPPAR